MDKVDEKFLQKFKELSVKFDELSLLMQSVEVVSDQRLLKHYMTEAKKIEDIASFFKLYQSKVAELKLANELLQMENNAEEKSKLSHRANQLSKEAEQIFADTKKIFLSKSNLEFERARIEISSKSGDINFVICLKDLFFKFAERLGYLPVVLKDEIGSKIFTLKGEGVFKKLDGLSGLYQQVIFGKKSTATVTILNEKVVDEIIDENDFEIQTSKSGGAGGQHINKTESAVRVTHLPTGLSAECEDERSQQKNKERAIENLKEKISRYYKENNEKYAKNQRNKLKNAIFTDTPVLIFDEDRNILTFSKLKKDYKLQDIKADGNLEVLTDDLRI